MEYSIDAHFQNVRRDLKIHFLTTFWVDDPKEAGLFYNELMAGFSRMNWEILHAPFVRIDNNEPFRASVYESIQRIEQISDNSMVIKQYLFENPDQSKSLTENLVKRAKENKDSTAVYRNYSVAVDVRDTNSGNRITGDLLFLKIEQLIDTTK